MEHLLWSFLRKFLTAKSHELFLQKNSIVDFLLGIKYSSVSRIVFRILRRKSLFLEIWLVSAIRENRFLEILLSCKTFHDSYNSNWKRVVNLSVWNNCLVEHQCYCFDLFSLSTNITKKYFKSNIFPHYFAIPQKKENL